MFTIEIKINGALISHIYGVTEGVLSTGDTKYRFEYYEPEVHNLIQGNVTHLRSDGIRTLIKKILEKVDKLI